MVNLDRRLVRPTADIAFADSETGEPTVVFTHGAAVDHSMFDAQAAALTERGVRVVLWDMRGHGRSSLSGETRFKAADALDDLGALLIETGVDAPVLVGHSLGGNLVQAFARQHPDRVGGLIIVDAARNTGALSRLEWFALRIAGPVLSLIPERSLPGVMARASAESEDAIRRTQALFDRMPKRRFLDVWRATTSFIGPDPAYRSPVPIALLRGKRDRTGNIATVMDGWASDEQVAPVVIPGAGHMVTWDAPEATSHALLAILDGWALLSAHPGAGPL